MTIRVGTWNVKHGHPDPSRLGSAAASLGRLDVLALQEVDVGVSRSREIDEVAAVADALGMASVFARTLSLHGGDYGIALLVRGDLAPDCIDLPGTGEPRVAIVASVATAQLQLSVAATHLSVRRAVSSEQLDAVIDALNGRPAPRLLLGDLNRTPHELRMHGGRGLRFVRVPRTFPARWSRAAIDHIAVSDDLRVEDVRAHRLPLSDHKAITATVTPAERSDRR